MPKEPEKMTAPTKMVERYWAKGLILASFGDSPLNWWAEAIKELDKARAQMIEDYNEHAEAIGDPPYGETDA